jgi:hypothetical protein
MQQDYNNEPFFVHLSLRWGGFVTTDRRDPMLNLMSKSPVRTTESTLGHV